MHSVKVLFHEHGHNNNSQWQTVQLFGFRACVFRNFRTERNYTFDSILFESSSETSNHTIEALSRAHINTHSITNLLKKTKYPPNDY